MLLLVPECVEWRLCRLGGSLRLHREAKTGFAPVGPSIRRMHHIRGQGVSDEIDAAIAVPQVLLATTESIAVGQRSNVFSASPDRQLSW